MNCASSNKPVLKYDTLISETNEGQLTEGRVYVALSDELSDRQVIVQGDDEYTYAYSISCFRYYNGEIIKGES